MIWFTSDTHYHHSNIVKGTSNWEEKPGKQRTRDFNTLEEHDKAIVDGINKVVHPNDILYHLGDWSFGGFDKIKEFRDQLKVRTIHLIYGNHDHHIERNKDGVRGLFTTARYYDEISIDGIRIILSHYAHRVWNKHHHGAFHLYGHSHNTLPDFGRSMDVGVDVAREVIGMYQPFSWNDIKDTLSKREIIITDHHNPQTT